jgi:hypothetical protein
MPTPEIIKRAADEIACIQTLKTSLEKKAKMRPDQSAMYNHLFVTLATICTLLQTL